MVVGPLWGPSCGLMDSTNSNWKTQQNYVCNEHVKIFLFPHRYYLKISLGRLFFFWREMKEEWIWARAVVEGEWEKWRRGNCGWDVVYEKSKTTPALYLHSIYIDRGITSSLEIRRAYRCVVVMYNFWFIMSRDWGILKILDPTGRQGIKPHKYHRNISVPSPYAVKIKVFSLLVGLISSHVSFVRKSYYNRICKCLKNTRRKKSEHIENIKQKIS